MDHVRGAHDVPWVAKSASIEQFVPPPPPVDSSASGLVGFVEGKSFWNFDGRSSVQRY